MPAPTTLNDAQVEFFSIAGYPSSSFALNDAFYAYLAGLGFTTGTLLDRQAAWLGGSGPLADRWSSFLTAQGYTTGSLNDRMFQFFAAEAVNPTWGELAGETWGDLSDNTWGEL